MTSAREMQRSADASRSNGAAKPWYRSAPIALALLACALLLPFSDKAFHIDDPLFVWIAQRVLRHPLDFYGFDVNWFGWTQPMHTIEQNPPLASYYAALAGAVLGFGERAMHAVVRDRNGDESRQSPRLLVTIDKNEIGREERPDSLAAGTRERHAGLAEDIAYGVEVSREFQVVVLIGVALALFVRGAFPGERIGGDRNVALGGQPLAFGDWIDLRWRSEAEQGDIGVGLGGDGRRLEAGHRARLRRDLRVVQIDQYRQQQRGQRRCGQSLGG